MSATAEQTPAEAGRTRKLPSVKVPPWFEKALVPILLIVAAFLPLFFDSGDTFIQTCTTALAYIVMALGLNIVVGFAGLLDLGYVAFFAIGAYTAGWFGSGFFSRVGGGEGWHILVSGFASKLPGIHVNFLLILVIAVIFTALAGVIIGLPTLRLRGDYIAIVTLAFGEIIGRIAVNGDDLKIDGQPLTAGRQGISPVDKIDLPFLRTVRVAGPADRGTGSRWSSSVSCCSSTSGCATRGSDARGSPCARTRSPRWRWASRRSRRSCWPTPPAPPWAASPARSSARS